MKLTSFHLKCIACATMLIDHIGAALFPQILLLRIVGRLAFPIFAFMMAEGYLKTKDPGAYIGRMAIFAVISQVPFVMAFSQGNYFNVFFTLTVALSAMHISEKSGNPFPVLIAAIGCQFANTDWGAFGVLLPYLFLRFRDDWPKLMINALILTLIFDGSYLLEFYQKDALTLDIATRVSIHFFWFISLIFIKLYNGERGPNFKYGFYAFYPVHLLIIGLLKAKGLF